MPKHQNFTQNYFLSQVYFQKQKQDDQYMLQLHHILPYKCHKQRRNEKTITQISEPDYALLEIHPANNVQTI